MASKEFESLRSTIVAAAERTQSRSKPFDVRAMRESMRSSPWPMPKESSTSTVHVEGITCHWLTAPDCRPDRRLLYLHGGGWVSGGFGSHGGHAARLAMASGCVVLLPEFRLAPEHPHPAALEDALVIYRWLREHGPSGESKASFVSVAGESGGGGLTLSLMLALRDGNESLPSAAVTFSAVTDLSCSGDSMKTRAGADIMVVPSQVREAADLYRGNTDAKSPLASPVFADPKGLPPLLMQVGDAEVFLSDTTRFAERARAAGVEVTLEIWPEMFHAFQLCSPVLPEGREALERAGRFLREKESLPAL